MTGILIRKGRDTRSPIPKPQQEGQPSLHTLYLAHFSYSLSPETCYMLKLGMLPIPSHFCLLKIYSCSKVHDTSFMKSFLIPQTDILPVGNFHCSFYFSHNAYPSSPLITAPRLSDPTLLASKRYLSIIQVSLTLRRTVSLH